MQPIKNPTIKGLEFEVLGCLCRWFRQALLRRCSWFSSLEFALVKVRSSQIDLLVQKFALVKVVPIRQRHEF